MQFKYISTLLFLAIVQISAAPSSDASVTLCHSGNDCDAGSTCCSRPLPPNVGTNLPGTCQLIGHCIWDSSSN
ncbi:hypothetical protein BDZ94DRAFT_1253928 [Collybia nuda]|uniref:Uncharacterized protein n=1 Tax=Collybia nuda TaxID=64659 RepID=A0A9P6CM93_9AGAR|nr:hypothetical protein BDZ94DRAFT_1253928 [Collybia nuda]